MIELGKWYVHIIIALKKIDRLGNHLKWKFEVFVALKEHIISACLPTVI